MKLPIVILAGLNKKRVRTKNETEKRIVVVLFFQAIVSLSM
jgi:hypothetical protein